MTHEEAARILDPETSAEALREYGDGTAQIAACDEACRIAADVLRGKHTGEALTLEQLREMLENDGEIIGAAIIVSENGVLSHGVLDCRSDDGICAVISASTNWLKEKDYGNGWAVYAYPPAHIDREAWEPCEVCGEKDPFGNPKFSHDFAISGSELYFCDSEFGWEGEKIKFCPFCGRPLTEEAWAELEDRMAVIV